MRTIVLLFTLGLAIGCAEMQNVESVQAGPRAGIHFLSSALADTPLALDQLSLLVLEPDRACAFSVKGNIPLSTGSSMKATYLSANRRAYFRIKRSSHGFFGGSSDAQSQFSFVLEDRVAYTIEHIDTPNGFA